MPQKQTKRDIRLEVWEKSIAKVEDGIITKIDCHICGKTPANCFFSLEYIFHPIYFFLCEDCLDYMREKYEEN